MVEERCNPPWPSKCDNAGRRAATEVRAKTRGRGLLSYRTFEVAQSTTEVFVSLSVCLATCRLLCAARLGSPPLFQLSAASSRTAALVLGAKSMEDYQIHTQHLPTTARALDGLHLAAFVLLGRCSASPSAAGMRGSVVAPSWSTSTRITVSYPFTASSAMTRIGAGDKASRRSRLRRATKSKFPFSLRPFASSSLQHIKQLSLVDYSRS